LSSFWVKEVEANECADASDSEAGKEANNEWQELRSKEAHDTTNDNEYSTCEWSNGSLIFGEREILHHTGSITLIRQ